MKLFLLEGKLKENAVYVEARCQDTQTGCLRSLGQRLMVSETISGKPKDCWRPCWQCLRSSGYFGKSPNKTGAPLSP